MKRENNDGDIRMFFILHFVPKHIETCTHQNHDEGHLNTNNKTKTTKNLKDQHRLEDGDIHLKRKKMKMMAMAMQECSSLCCFVLTHTNKTN